MKPLCRTRQPRSWLLLLLIACCACAPGAPLARAAEPAPAAGSSGGSDAAAPEDPLLWLEEVHGERAMNWVDAENKRTLGTLESDPRFRGMLADALAISQAQDRIPYPDFEHHAIFNFWKDDRHARGLWRQTTLGDYKTSAPHWTTVLDLDALAASESANWIWEGADCLRPAEQRCLVSLSDGGEDAQTVREFDLTTREFVKGGFVLPTSKQGASWIDQDHLLVSRDWGSGTLTASGYPYIVKTLARGQDLASAQEVFRGQPDDVGVEPSVLQDGAGHRVTLIVRWLSYFESDFYLITAQGPKHLNLPRKASVDALVANRLLITIKEPWTVGGRQLVSGSLVSIDADAARADSEHLLPTLVYEPGPLDAIAQVAATRSRLIIVLTHNVRGRALVLTPEADGRWQRRTLALPDQSTLDVISTSLDSDQAFLTVTGFVTPTSLWLADLAGGKPSLVKQLSPKFDGTHLVVEQREAISKDGTHVPYFIVHPRDMQSNGTNPTILTAYGGFQISMTPYYGGVAGKLWMEKGGVYVLANIRGGGEFGPAWHEAGLKTHRQVIYDDFAAVAEDLIARKVTSPRHLGIMGGSNGGLLMGVEFNQHPGLWNAVDIQVPLLDMLRYEQLAAGPSWVAEYGSVSVPEERAFLAGISPYQNIRKGVQYPEPLIWTTTKDDRVGPQQARKFAARLASDGIPYLYYEVIEGGHGAGANIEESTHTETLEFLYFTRKLMD